MLPLAIAGIFFLLTATLVGWAGYWAMTHVRRRLDAPAEIAAIRGQVPSVILKPDQVSSIGIWAQVLEQLNFSQRLKTTLEEADLDWSVGRLALVMATTGLSTIVLLSRFPFVPIMIAVGAGLLTWTIPYFWVTRRRQQRLDAFKLHFADALDSLARSLKAGHALAAGMDSVASEAEPPVSSEFRQTLDEWRLGSTWDQALGNLARRVPLLDVQIFVAAVRQHSRSGGKLTEVLSSLAESMRENNAIEGEVRAISAHGRMTGIILTVLPIFIAAMMMYVNPSYMMVLFTDSTGRILVMAAAGSLVAAHFVIQFILRIRI